MSLTILETLELIMFDARKARGAPAARLARIHDYALAAWATAKGIPLAQAIEARRVETVKQGSIGDESAVA